MKIATFCMTAANGWAVPTSPSFDPSRTLVVAFGDPAFLDAHGPIRRLAAAYPGATLQDVPRPERSSAPASSITVWSWVWRNSSERS